MKVMFTILTIAIFGYVHAGVLKDEELKELDDTILKINIGISEIEKAIAKGKEKGKKKGGNGGGDSGHVVVVGGKKGKGGEGGEGEGEGEGEGDGEGEGGAGKGDFDISDHIFEINEKDHVQKDLFEGDILIERGQITKYKSADGVQGDLIKESYKHWDITGKVVYVPYVYNGASQKARTAFQLAVNDFNTKTCIRIIPRTNQVNYLSVISASGCYSYVGKQSNRRFPRGQPLSLGNGCETKGIAIHELMHAIGYYHEQSRPDRDTYVTINLQNIKAGRENNFLERDSDMQGTQYDTNSIMHYGAYAFSRNGQKTITEKRGRSIGQRSGFSPTDLKSINAKYCGNSDCFDQFTSCSFLKRFCNARNWFLKYFRNLARKYCKASCGIC